MRSFFTCLIGCILVSASVAIGQNVKTYVTKEADTSDRTLLIPNAFSPNNDGKNDVFHIINFTDQTLIEFKVFNRWGTILFQTGNPKVGWDGMYKGKEQPTGLYGYVIRIAYADNVVETYKGTVTLIR